MAAAEAAGGTAGDYYKSWDQYAAKANEADEDEEADEAALRAAEAWRDNRPRPTAHGYEFRKGHKTQFPDCTAQPGEGDEAAAFRVAGERRAAGVESFKDGTVWGAQMAVDAWGQGLLALERLKNLRKYKPLEAVTPESLDEGAEREGEAAVAAGPSEEEAAALTVTMRLNIAQALLKLREYEACIPHCEKALELDPTSTKGLWRKAKAVWGIRNPGMAREALHRLLELDEGNAAAIAMLKEIDQEEAKKRAKRTGVQASAPARGAVGVRREGHSAPTTAPAEPSSAAVAEEEVVAGDRPLAPSAAAATSDSGGDERRRPQGAEGGEEGGWRWPCCRGRRRPKAE